NDWWLVDEPKQDYPTKRSDVYLTAASDGPVELWPSELSEYHLSADQCKPIEGRGTLSCPCSGRTVLEHYLAHLPGDMRVDDAHEIVFEQVQSAEDHAAYWRTYYVFSKPVLDGGSLAYAWMARDAATLRPEVMVELDRAGQRTFGRITSENVGH